MVNLQEKFGIITLTISALLAPVTINTHMRALLMTGIVRLILLGGGFGAFSSHVTHMFSSSRAR